ncbi:hypothetical protein BGZ76_002834 [Entomortierella beljakovae]|nr:hypothetical protein BGZ76_002834 [Entomortierella beljakovae]
MTKFTNYNKSIKKISQSNDSSKRAPRPRKMRTRSSKVLDEFFQLKARTGYPERESLGKAKDQRGELEVQNEIQLGKTTKEKYKTKSKSFDNVNVEQNFIKNCPDKETAQLLGCPFCLYLPCGSGTKPECIYDPIILATILSDLKESEVRESSFRVTNAQVFPAFKIHEPAKSLSTALVLRKVDDQAAQQNYQIPESLQVAIEALVTTTAEKFLDGFKSRLEDLLPKMIFNQIQDLLPDINNDQVQAANISPIVVSPVASPPTSPVIASSVTPLIVVSPVASPPTSPVITSSVTPLNVASPVASPPTSLVASPPTSPVVASSVTPLIAASPVASPPTSPVVASSVTPPDVVSPVAISPNNGQNILETSPLFTTITPEVDEPYMFDGYPLTQAIFDEGFDSENDDLLAAGQDIVQEGNITKENIAKEGDMDYEDNIADVNNIDDEGNIADVNNIIDEDITIRDEIIDLDTTDDGSNIDLGKLNHFEGCDMTDTAVQADLSWGESLPNALESGSGGLKQFAIMRTASYCSNCNSKMSQDFRIKMEIDSL